MATVWPSLAELDERRKRLGMSRGRDGQTVAGVSQPTVTRIRRAGSRIRLAESAGHRPSAGRLPGHFPNDAGGRVAKATCTRKGASAGGPGPRHDGSGVASRRSGSPGTHGRPRLSPTLGRLAPRSLGGLTMTAWPSIPGETPIDPSGLKRPGIITNRRELNVAEAENILKVVTKYLSRKPTRKLRHSDYAWTLRAAQRHVWRRLEVGRRASNQPAQYWCPVPPDSTAVMGLASRPSRLVGVWNEPGPAIGPTPPSRCPDPPLSKWQRPLVAHVGQHLAEAPSISTCRVAGNHDWR